MLSQQQRNDNFISQGKASSGDDKSLGKPAVPIADADDGVAALLSTSLMPPDAPDEWSVDYETAKGLSVLPNEDRLKAYDDIHGTAADEVQETPAFVETSLVQLETELECLSDKDAYNLALSKNAQYAQNRDFRLMFLRADQFDCKKAALRISRHFESKLELFGKEKLVIDITQDDLTQEDMQSLYSGFGRFLPIPDQSGRRIIIFVSNRGMNAQPTISKLRRMFYGIMLQLQKDPELSNRGVVIVVYGLDHQVVSGVNSVGISWKGPKLLKGLPARIVAIHICSNSRLLQAAYALFKVSSNFLTRIRIRSHYGSHHECLSQLKSHGIQPKFLPIEEGGVVTDIDQWTRLLENERCRERLTQPRRDRIFVPSQHDVLFGKGSPFQNHGGNKKFRARIIDCRKAYEKANRGNKQAVAQGIVDSVVQSSGMFLRPDNADGWIAVDNTQARLKVSTTFRTIRGEERKGRVY